jgi:hypothetical protein
LATFVLPQKQNNLSKNVSKTKYLKRNKTHFYFVVIFMEEHLITKSIWPVYFYNLSPECNNNDVKNYLPAAANTKLKYR